MSVSYAYGQTPKKPRSYTDELPDNVTFIKSTNGNVALPPNPDNVEPDKSTEDPVALAAAAIHSQLEHLTKHDNVIFEPAFEESFVNNLIRQATPAFKELIGAGADVLELLELLKNPSVRALLLPPTELEKEVEALVSGEIKPAEYYPRHKAKDKEPPAEFLRRIYGRYVEAECLYLDQLRAIDPGLVQALLNWDSYRGTKESAVLGRERERADRLLRDLSPILEQRILHLGTLLLRRKAEGTKPITRVNS